ncbi:MAG: lamin tail domain-containing protein [Acidobacteria bacterium]|nr:lamin tail domain-containing protein [Acidobacteriota bacterium]
MSSLGRLCCAAIAILTLGTVFSDSYSVSAQLIISEFRVRGPNGANDEFIELFNNSGADHTVAGGGTGYAVAASNGVARCVVPNGTVIPNRGHYLCVNSVGYSLASYPAGNGTTATGDATYTTDIPDNAGIAIFNTSVAGDFVLANRLDAVGSTSEANTLYKEGAGYPALTPFSIDYSFYRKIVGTCTNAPNNCGLVSGSFPIEGVDSVVQDTNSNAVDFVFVDTNGTSAGAGQRLGAPGPENLSGPVVSDSTISGTLLDSTVSRHAPPNRQRDGGTFCAPPNPVVLPCDPANNSTFGTISFRRHFTNNTGLPVTRLRFRVVDQTTFPAVSGVADLRNRTSSAVVIATINDAATCAAKIPPEAAPCSVTVQGTTLETPPLQPNGSAYNSTMSAGTVTLATPILPGASINVQFLFGIQQVGNYRAYVHIEALTEGVVELVVGQNSGGVVGKKKFKHAPQTSVAPAGQSSPASTEVPVITPLTRRLGNSGIWVFSPGALKDAPARTTADDKPKADDEAKENSKKESETAPATSEQPAPPMPAPAAAKEPVATTTTPAAAPVVTNTTSAAPVAAAATRVNVQKENVSASKAGQRSSASRRTIAHRRGALKRR